MIDSFIAAPWYGQFAVSFTGLFLFFVLVIKLRNIIVRNKWESNSVAKIIFYPLTLLFVISDALFNIVYAPALFKLERANKHGEGWLLTSRMKHHIRQGKEDLKADRDVTWNFKMSVFLCTYFAEPVDPNHCGLKY